MDRFRFTSVLRALIVMVDAGQLSLAVPFLGLAGPLLPVPRVLS